MKRRVYVLPDSLLERVERFRETTGLPSEVAAVRHLIAAGLNATESPDDFVERLRPLGRTAALAEALGHSLVVRLKLHNDHVVIVLADRELRVDGVAGQ